MTAIHQSPERGAILGLDGLRAVSVLAVLLYHARFPWMRGGFLGVEVFFVISGFLITGLLLKELQATGAIDLRRFWVRRLRRLLPALLVFLFCLGAVAALFLGDRASQFRADLVASFGYGENWYQIYTGSSYFADQGLPLLRHLWSLAVEGQFYLAWPLLVAAVVRLSRGRTLPLLVLTGVLAAVSGGLSAALADPGNPSGLKAMASLNRVYLGTDTRALGLLAGAALALLLQGRQARGALARALGPATWLAFLGLGALLARTDFQTPFLYRGGFLLVDGLTAVILAGLALPGPGGLAGMLGWWPLEWLGQRSYGLYLWHWPVFRLLAPGQQGWPWFLARVLLAVLLTEASYRYVEVPVRTGGLARWLAKASLGGPVWRRRAPHALGVALVLALAWETTALAGRAPYLDPVQASIQAGAAALDHAPPAPHPVSGPAAAPAPPTPPAAIVLPADLKGVRLTAVGDSVMKGAAVALKKTGEACLGEGMIQINAEECRSFAGALTVIQEYRQDDRLGEVVVVHLGANNSSIPQEQFRRLMAALADRRLVLFLTAKSDKTEACDLVNRALESLVGGFANARVFDWKTAGDAHPEYFYSDKTHLRPEGARFYAETILSQIVLPAREAPVRLASRLQ